VLHLRFGAQPAGFSTTFSQERVLIMEQKNDETVVVFRVWNRGGDVIALFPELPGSSDPSTCLCYECAGQHGHADTSIVRSCTRAASEAEYAPLKRELEMLGYSLQVQTRFPSHSHLKRRQELGLLWR
jgi:hypothetical protein